MKSLLFVFLLVGLPLQFVALSAQAHSEFVRNHVDFLKAGIQPTPTFKLQAASQPGVELKDHDVETDLVKVRTRLGKVFGVGKDTAVLAAFNYALRNYEFDSVGNLGTDLDENLHEIAVEVGVQHFLTDRLLVALDFRPGIFSDLDDGLERDDILLQGTALGIYQIRKDWFVKLGLAVGELFPDSVGKVVPLAGMSWVASEQLRVDVLLPVTAKVTWQPFEDRPFLLVPGVYLMGQKYHVEVQSREGDIQIQDIRADLTASYEVATGSRVSLSVGSNFRGKYEVEGERGFEADATQKPSLYLAIGFSSWF